MTLKEQAASLSDRLYFMKPVTFSSQEEREQFEELQKDLLSFLNEYRSESNEPNQV